MDRINDCISRGCGFLSKSSFTSIIDNIRTIIPSIVNIRNMLLHELISIMYPPIVGPIAGTIPIINPNSPITSDHFSSGITLNSTICVIGIIIPVPAASSILPINTISIFGDMYTINDPIVNNVNDVINMLFSLKRLEMYAVGGIITARMMRNME